MRLTESVSFWIILISLIIGCLIGSITHWIVGVVIFFLIAGKTALIGIILDTISGSLSYHHDREDLRMKKTLESIMFMRTGIKPAFKAARFKILNIRR